jgi:hypothetical protein
MADVLCAFSFAKVKPGKPFYVSDKSAEKTYSVEIDSAGMLTHMKLFAEQGGESVISDAAGNVYIAEGQNLRLQPGRSADWRHRSSSAPNRYRIRRQKR